MKPVLLFCFLFIISFFNEVCSQSIAEQMTKKHPDCNDVFLNAVNILPKLYRKNAFDSMYVALQIWKQACGNNQEVQCISLLLTMEQNRFTATALDKTVIDLLNNYSHSFIYFQNKITVQPDGQAEFYKLSSLWAKLLMEQKTLDENEKFICAVFTGAVTQPEKEIKNNPEKYPQLFALVTYKEAAQRKGLRSNVAFLAGIWMPDNDLKILGNHPSLGFQVGFRDVHFQVDFSLQFRFSQSAHPYFVKRNNVLYQSLHYFGGYIGIDYTLYLVSRQKYDVGVLVGAGYDGFDISSSEDNVYLRPVSIGSFNANGGLKFNWYITPTFYVGVQGRYNLINYTTRGGSSLQGNAFSIDLIIGKTKLKY